MDSAVYVPGKLGQGEGVQQGNDGEGQHLKGETREIDFLVGNSGVISLGGRAKVGK